MGQFNHFNAELNPTCHLLALLGAHHILHFSRVRVNFLRRVAEAKRSVACDVVSPGHCRRLVLNHSMRSAVPEDPSAT
jgi:hypothetical protein